MRLHHKMQPTVLALVLAAGAVLMTGCHGSTVSNAFEVPSDFDASKSRTITFWAKNDTNKTQTKIYQNAIDTFEKMYPGIKIKLKLYTDYGKIYNDVITNISTGTTPDVCITYPDHIATYLTGSNVVVPLDSLMEDDKYGLGGSELLFDGPDKDEIVAEFLAEGRLGDAAYAVPFMRSTEVCYVNETFVEKLGYTLPETLTWDFVWEVSEAAMEKDKKGNFKVNGQKVMIPFIYKSTDNMMIQMLRQKDAGYSDESGEISIFNDTTEELLKEIGKHAKTGAFSTFKISSYPANFLNAGQCIFAVDSTAGSTWMGSEAPLIDIAEDKIVDFKTRVMTVPQFDPEQPKMISQGPSICIFNKEDPEEVLASWLFTQYLLSDEVQTAYAETEGYVPVTTKARESESYQEYLAQAGQDNQAHYEVKMEATKLLLENTENTFTTPVFNGSASLRDAAGQMIEEVTKAARRKIKINDAFIQSVFDKVSSLNHLDQIQVEGSTEGRKELGPMPMESIMLLAGLGVIWVGILLTLLFEKMKAARQRKM